MPVVWKSSVKRERLNTEEVPSLPSEVLRETFASAYEEAPVLPGGLFDRTAELERAQGIGAGRMARPQVARITAEQAMERVKRNGLEGHLAFDKDTTEEAVDLLSERKRKELYRQDISTRSPGGLGLNTAKFGLAVGTSLADPASALLNFVPIVSQARYARWLKAGGSALGRTGVRAGVGAAEGAAGAAIFEPVLYSAKQAEQADYDSTDSLLNIAFGGVTGGGIHMIGGASADAYRALRGIEQPWAMKSPLRNAITAGMAAREKAPVTITPEMIERGGKTLDDAVDAALGAAAEPVTRVNALLDEPMRGINALSLPDSTKSQLRSVYETAASVKPGFDKAIREISDELGVTSKPLIPDDLKGVDRASEKIMADYAGDASRIKDIVRATVVVDDIRQAVAAIAAATRKFGEPAKLRNTLMRTVETPDGYRDVNMNFKIDGHTVEVQVNVPEMLAAKKGMHKLYEERRTLDAKSVRTAAEDSRIAALDAQMKATYAAAWNEALSRSNSSSEISTPSSRASRNETGRPAGTSKARVSEPPPSVDVRDTGTPSQSKNLGSLSKNDISVSSTRIVNAADLVEQASLKTREAALRTATTQLAEGDDISVAGLFPDSERATASPDPDTAPARSEAADEQIREGDDSLEAAEEAAKLEEQLTASQAKLMGIDLKPLMEAAENEAQRIDMYAQAAELAQVCLMRGG